MEFLFKNFKIFQKRLNLLKILNDLENLIKSQNQEVNFWKNFIHYFILCYIDVNIDITEIEIFKRGFTPLTNG